MILVFKVQKDNKICSFFIFLLKNRGLKNLLERNLSLRFFCIDHCFKIIQYLKNEFIISSFILKIYNVKYIFLTIFI